jgi:hypothetical protein
VRSPVPTPLARPSFARRRAPAPLLLALAAVLACGRSDDSEPSSENGRGAASGGRRGERGRRSSESLLIAPLPAPYRTADLAGGGGGSVQGVVEVDGDVPRDTVVRPASEQGICGASLVDTTIELFGERKLGGVVVWLDGVAAGKPVPLARRFELTNEHCRLTPRVQAAIAGGTLNVRNVDPLLHRTRFTAGPPDSPETLAVIDQTDAGQVVPNEDVLREAALVEVRCATHPWTRAHLAVFDHPYFTVTRTQGVFVMDSVPPGRHRLIAWHERFGRVEQTVEVKAGEAVRVTVKMKGK